MLLGLSTVSVIGVVSTLFYFFIYILTSIQIFYIISIIRRQTSKLKIKNLVDFVALSRANFFLSVLLICGLLSFAGIPPMAGFFGKVFVIYALIIQGQYLLAL